jgi:hypothetical protein
LCIIAAAVALLPVQAALAQAPAKTQGQAQSRQQVSDGDIYGSQLMTQQERNEYRARMQNAQTEQERERIRAEHHERMQARAKERGVTLPDKPPAGRGPAGPGGGTGTGAGPGAGSGR